MLKIYHIDRDLNKTLEQQKKELKKEYSRTGHYEYLFSDGKKIHIMVEKDDSKSLVTTQEE